MSNEDQLREQYLFIRPQLDQLVEDLKGWLAIWCNELKVYSPRIEGRAKECHSLLNKVLERQMDGKPYADPLTDLSDKVGVRADVIYASDIDRLVDRIREATDALEAITDKNIDDKRFSLSENEVGYSGVHVDVVPLERRGLARRHAKCEIQIRTNAQAAWAMASHELAYKPAVKRTKRDKRKVFRLTALLELFDEQISQSRKALMSDPNYPAAKVIEALRDARFRFRAGEFNPVLTQDIVSRLVETQELKNADELVTGIMKFAVEHATRLENVLSRDYPSLVAQPEAILIFKMLENDPYACQERWAEAGLPNGLLEKMANAWGIRLPAPL